MKTSYYRSVIGLLCAFILLFSSSCAIHPKFPFICFLPSCVKNQFSVKGLKKRIGGKISAAKRNRDKKKRLASKAKSGDLNIKNQEVDTVTSGIGNTVQYSKYLIIFKSKSAPERIDTLLIKHMSEYKTITEAGQSAIVYLVEQRQVSNIYLVEIRAVRRDELDAKESMALNRSRVRAIRKFLRRTGIPRNKIVYVSQ